jgi:multiple sugar transport system permease protein
VKRALFFLALAACVVAIFLFRHRESSESFPGVTLRYSFWGSDTEIKAMEAICRRFETLHPGVRIKTEPLPWGQYWLKMKTQAANTGGSPDVIRMTSIQAAEWYSYRVFLDLTPFIRRDGVTLADYYPASVSAVTWDNHVLSMPTDSAVRVLIYNKGLFDRAGLPYLDPKVPRTWDELRDVARRLTVTKDGKVVQYGLSLGYMEFQAFVAQAGGRCVDRLVNPTRVLIDSPEGIRALAFYSGLILNDRVSPVTMQQQNLGFGAPDFALRSGKVAIQFGGTWSIPALSKEKWLRFGLAPVARDRERSQVAFTNSCGVYALSAHPEEAWQFVRFMASPEGQEIIARENIGIPVLRSVARSDAFLKNTPGVENMDVFLDELECAETNVMVPTGEFRDRMDKIVTQQLCLGGITPGEAAKRMETDGDRLIAAVPLKPTALTGWALPALLVAALVAICVLLIVRAIPRHRDRELVGAPARGETLAGYLFISPWLIGFVCFALGPMLVALGVAFTDWNIFQPARYVGVENYRRALSSATEFWSPLKVTLIFACASIPIQMVGGLVCAMLLNSPRLRLTGLFRAVIYLPYLLTGVAISIVWRWMYAENGLVNHLLGAAGIPGPNWLMSEGWALSAIVLMEFTWLGGNMIIFLAALQGVPRSLYDAAEVDGAGALRKFRHVTVPMITPAILFNLIMGTIASFQVFAVPYIMTDGGPNDATLFYVLNLYRRAFGYNEMGYACTLAVMLFFIIFAVTWLELRSSRRWVYYEGTKG